MTSNTAIYCAELNYTDTAQKKSITTVGLGIYNTYGFGFKPHVYLSSLYGNFVASLYNKDTK